jgi:hypothetical protein
MTSFLPKAGSSRLIKAQNLRWTGTGTLVSTPLASETFQVRIIAQTAGYVAVVSSTADSMVPTTAGLTGMYISANTANGDFLTTSPSMLVCYASTSTSTTNPGVSIGEMA